MVPPAFLGLSYDEIQGYVLTWAPVLFMGLIVFFLWRTLKLMPRTKPQQIKPESAHSTSWEEIAGVEEAKHELQEVVEFLRSPRPFKRLGAETYMLNRGESARNPAPGKGAR